MASGCCSGGTDLKELTSAVVSLEVSSLTKTFQLSALVGLASKDTESNDKINPASGLGQCLVSFIQ